MAKESITEIALSGLEHAAICAALVAGDVLRDGFYSRLEIKQKSSIHDVVTQFDVRAEEAIIKTIREDFPDHAFLGEEGGLKGSADSPFVWVIDPIDGTWNFSRQIPSFSTSIAVLHHKKVVLAVCYDPIANELFIGKRGQGASMNGKKLSVSKIKTLEDSGVSLGGTVGVNAIHQIAQIRRSGSSVLDIAYVAKGALEGFIEWNLQLWDFVGAMLLVEEAGGMITSMTGAPLELEFGKKYDIIGSNGLIHKDLIKWLSSTVKK